MTGRTVLPVEQSSNAIFLVSILLLLQALDEVESLRGPGAVLQVGDEPVVGKIERVRVLPVVVGDLAEPLHHIVAPHLDRLLTMAVDATTSEVDRAHALR